MQLLDVDGKKFVVSRQLVEAATRKFVFELKSASTNMYAVTLLYKGKYVDSYLLEKKVLYKMLGHHRAVNAMSQIKRGGMLTLSGTDRYMGVALFLIIIKGVLRAELKERKRKGAQEWAHANAVKEAKQRTEAFDKELAALRKRIAELEVARREYALESSNPQVLYDQVKVIRERLASHRMRMIDKM